MRFSIIVPIYKVEEYLLKCVDSVLNQTYKDYELILVDDGSPDSCPKICDEYNRKYNHIQVVHKENGGSSSARNAGLYIAKGDYIIFLDGDDYWDDPKALHWISNQIDTYKNDIVIWGLKFMDMQKKYIGRSRLNRKPYNVSYINRHSVTYVLKHLESHKQYPGSAWLFAVKKDVLFENHIFFIEENLGEDYDWVTKVLFKVQSIGCINRNFYVYRINRNGSITNQRFNRAHVQGMIDAVVNWLTVCDKTYIGITRNLAKVYTLALRGFIELPINEQDNFIQSYIQGRKILKISHSAIYVLLYYSLCVIGVKTMSRAMNVAYKLLHILRSH